LVLLALGAYALMATRAAVKTSAEEAAKEAIRQLQWRTYPRASEDQRYRETGASLQELRCTLERTPTTCDLRRHRHRQESSKRSVLEVERLVLL
jgi:hypothetical protein